MPKLTHQKAYREKLTKYEVAGLLSLRPGMAYMIELMQEALDRLDGDIDRARGRQERLSEDETEQPEEREERGPSAQAAYWARMTPAERRKEMRKRGMVGRGKSKTNGHAAAVPTVKLTKAGRPWKGHPRDPNHPDHEAWVKKMSKSNKASWARLSQADRDARTAKMLEGRLQ